jgi:hypothetical protein
MIRELIEAGGPGALIPVAFAAGAMYLANWLLGLEHRRSERRRQFLELWPKRAESDELWSQVALSCTRFRGHHPKLIASVPRTGLG